MGILNWFKRPAAEAGDVAVAPPPAGAGGDRSVVVEGLNFMSAIDVHMKWRNRLETYIQGNSKEDLQVEAISRDDDCVLGKWIYGAGSERFGTLPTFAEMKAQHAHFHTCAGKVLATATAGHKQEALHMLAHGDYLRASERVKMLLAKLYVEIAERG
jgi:hypothetical protein